MMIRFHLDHAGIAFCHQRKYSVGEHLRKPLLLHACMKMGTAMDENPYKSPLCRRDTIRGFSIRFTRLLKSSLGRFAVGCVALAPACWLLGRALIPPDDAALRFSLAAWSTASIVWAGLVWLNSPAH